MHDMQACPQGTTDGREQVLQQQEGPEVQLIQPPMALAKPDQARQWHRTVAKGLLRPILETYPEVKALLAAKTFWCLVRAARVEQSPALCCVYLCMT